jgi:hypothetical protein
VISVATLIFFITLFPGCQPREELSIRKYSLELGYFLLGAVRVRPVRADFFASPLPF